MFWANGAALLHSQANRLLVSQQASQPRAWTAAALMQGCEQEAHWFSGGPQLICGATVSPKLHSGQDSHWRHGRRGGSSSYITATLSRRQSGSDPGRLEEGRRGGQWLWGMSWERFEMSKVQDLEHPVCPSKLGRPRRAQTNRKESSGSPGSTKALS